jgi:hypothetical protein
METKHKASPVDPFNHADFTIGAVIIKILSEAASRFPSLPKNARPFAFLGFLLKIAGSVFLVFFNLFFAPKFLPPTYFTVVSKIEWAVACRVQVHVVVYNEI